jgi:hypothetical protein
MDKYSLPLCPCGSGKLYEECCYKKKGADGEPLFFKGAFTRSADKIWHPIPKVRFALIIGGQEVDKYREAAKGLVNKSKLAEKNHKHFINNYGLFYQAYEQLLKSFKSSGKGASFQMDTIEVRKYWKDFLFNGRILLDFIGLHSREALGLNQDIGGLDKKKYENLLNTLKELGAKNKNFLEVKAELEPLKNDILIFIDFRDKEKTPHDTIVEFPAIDDEYGLVKDGKISLNGDTFDMIKFIKKSYESICKLILILLGIDHEAKS